MGKGRESLNKKKQRNANKTIKILGDERWEGQGNMRETKSSREN